MQAIFVTGRIGKDAETRQAGSDSVCSFSLAVDQGFGERKTTNWFRCNLWGKRGNSLQQYLIKGAQVAVQGELTIGEYNNAPQFDIRINEVDLMGGKQESSGNGGGQARQGRAQQNSATRPALTDDDLDSDFVPF